MRKIMVFGGSNNRQNEAYLQATDQLARVLVEQEISLVYKGDKVGLLGRLAESVLRLGGEVIGVIPEKLVSKELANRGISVLHIVKSIHERNTLLAELCDGFIALPGGTPDEIIEVFAQPRYYTKPCGLLNIASYYDKLLECMQVSILKAEHKEWLIVEKDPSLIIHQMQEMVVEYVDR